MKINFLFMMPILLATCSCCFDNSGSLPTEKHLALNDHAYEDDEEESSVCEDCFNSCKAALLAVSNNYKNDELEKEIDKEKK